MLIDTVVSIPSNKISKKGSPEDHYIFKLREKKINNIEIYNIKNAFLTVDYSKKSRFKI